MPSAICGALRMTVAVVIVTILAATIGSPIDPVAASSPPAGPVEAAPGAWNLDEGFDVPDTTRGAPANPVLFTQRQPDGSGFVARRIGDGASNWMETETGHAVVEGDDGYYRYAQGTDGEGRLVASSVVVADGAVPPVGPGVRPVISDGAGGAPEPSGAPGSYPQDSPERAPAARGATPQSGASSPLLVILIEWNDVKATTTPAQWADRFFGSPASVRDFYSQASYGDFDIEPAAEVSGVADGVVGWLDMGIDHPDVPSSQARPYIKSAIEKADPYVDFASYDTDGDGYVGPSELMVTVIWAGFEESYGTNPCGASVWAHRWTLTAPASADGVKVARFGYTAFGELHCDAMFDPTGHMATIGVMAHEIGHELGWPDLYNVNQTDNGGVGRWSLMAYGSWNTVPGGKMGSSPALPDAFLRTLSGWVEPVQVDSVTGRGVVSVTTGADVVRVLDNPGGVDWAKSSPSGTGEYFLVENRQKSGYDAGLPGCGLLIWHIDETASPGSGANAQPGHRLVQLMQADGLAGLDAPMPGSKGDAGDPYPGSTGNPSFGPMTSPASVLNTGDPSWVEIDVASSGCASTMYIDVDIWSAPAPPAKPVVVAGDGEATVSWSAPDDGGTVITGYTVTSAPGANSCTTGGATTCTVGGLTNGVPYTFSVSATNAVGAGPASVPSDPTTPSPPQPGAITGMVTGIGGAAVPGIVVRLFDDDLNVVASRSTDETGSYSFSGLDSSRRFKVRAIPRGDERYGITFNSGASSFAGAPWVDVVPGGTTTVDMALRQVFSIVGTVSDQAGPVHKAKVVLRDAAPGSPALLKVKTDPSGAYSMVGLTLGVYQVMVKSPDGTMAMWWDGALKPEDATAIDLSSPGVHHVDFVLPGGATAPPG